MIIIDSILTVVIIVLMIVSIRTTIINYKEEKSKRDGDGCHKN